MFYRLVQSNSPNVLCHNTGHVNPQTFCVLFSFHSFLVPLHSLSFFFSLLFLIFSASQLSLISFPDNFYIYICAYLLLFLLSFLILIFYSLSPFLVAFLFQFWLPHPVLFTVAFCCAFIVCRFVLYIYSVLSFPFFSPHFILPHLISPLYSVYTSPVILHALPHADSLRASRIVPIRIFTLPAYCWRRNFRSGRDWSPCPTFEA